MTLAAKQKTLPGLSEGDQKSVMANRVYQQWLQNKKVEEQQKTKEKRVQQEWKALQDRQVHLEKEKAQISFSSWKARKDMERDLLFEHNRVVSSERMNTVKETPLLPGYCSVWACDEELAVHMVTQVQRQI